MRSTTWNPGVAAVLSFLIPGLGQLYKGWIGRGLAFLVFTVLGYVLVIIPGIAMHVWAIVDAYRSDSKAEHDDIYDGQRERITGANLMSEAMKRESRER